MKRKNTYISLFHLLVFCLAVLPGSLLHTHHCHEAEEQLNACQLHIEYHDLAIGGKCEHSEHFSAEGDHCFACVLHYSPLFTEAREHLAFRTSGKTITLAFDVPRTIFTFSGSIFNKGPPVSA